MWFSAWLGTLLRAQIFDVNNGNEDWADLVDPSKYGLENTQNIFFRSEDPRGEKDMMGGWFISPLGKQTQRETLSRKDTSETCSASGDCSDGKVLLDVDKLTEEDTVFILLHGNAKNRGASHRIAAYKIFQSFGFYTLTMDYRGYGDSIMSFPINGTTLVEDAKAAIKLVRDSVGDDAKLILYGHSMGTGVSSQAVSEIKEEGVRVDGIILDSPFHSFKGMLKLETTLGATLNYLLGLEEFLLEADVAFDNPKYLVTLDIPVRVFHATVDQVCPIEGSRKLIEDVKAGGKENIDLVVWEQEGLGHIGISKTESFPKEIERFALEVHRNFSRGG